MIDMADKMRTLVLVLFTVVICTYIANKMRTLVIVLFAVVICIIMTTVLSQLMGCGAAPAVHLTVEATGSISTAYRPVHAENESPITVTGLTGRGELEVFVEGVNLMAVATWETIVEDLDTDGELTCHVVTVRASGLRWRGALFNDDPRCLERYGEFAGGIATPQGATRSSLRP